MKKKEFLSIVRKQIRYIFVRDSIEEELKQHLNDSMEAIIEEGLPWQEAEEEAVRRMGDPIQVGMLLNKEHKPLLGYLLVVSRIVLCILMLRVVITYGAGVFLLMKSMTPATLENSVETYEVNIEMDLPTHQVKIDNICLNKNEQYCLTFRAWPKFKYSRAGWSSDCFNLENKEGEMAGGATLHGFGSFLYGSKDFEWPEDSLLYIVAVDGKVIELDLTEYCDEKR